MYTGLTHTHNLLRYIILILLILSIIKFAGGHFGKKTFTQQDRKLSLFTMIALHLQLVIGLALYFIPEGMGSTAMSLEGWIKIPSLRFYGLEHFLNMVVAIILITIGYSSAKRAQLDKKKFKRLFWTYLIGTIIILAAIPWPWRAVGIARDWF